MVAVVVIAGSGIVVVPSMEDLVPVHTPYLLSDLMGLRSRGKVVKNLSN